VKLETTIPYECGTDQLTSVTTQVVNRLLSNSSLGRPESRHRGKSGYQVTGRQIPLWNRSLRTAASYPNLGNAGITEALI
jgi:hypothetical protein